MPLGKGGAELPPPHKRIFFFFCITLEPRVECYHSLTHKSPKSHKRISDDQFYGQSRAKVQLGWTWHEVVSLSVPILVHMFYLRVLAHWVIYDSG
jgi:hypothetical protein